VNPLGSLITQLRAFGVPAPEIRAEMWALGTRHRGKVLEGARLEAGAPDVSPQRAILLAAVIRSHRLSAKGRGAGENQ
jgi:hypothetical protein